MLAIEPTAARLIRMPTDIFDRRSILLSIKMTIGTSVNVQSARMLMTPYMYPLLSASSSEAQFFEPSVAWSNLAGLPQWKMDSKK